MTGDDSTGDDRHVANALSRLYTAGGLVATVLLAAGAVLGYLLEDSAGSTVLLTGGCGLILLLPIARLGMMTGHFARIGDAPYAVISAVVIVLVLVTAAVTLW